MGPTQVQRTFVLESPLLLYLADFSLTCEDPEYHLWFAAGDEPGWVEVDIAFSSECLVSC